MAAFLAAFSIHPFFASAQAAEAGTGGAAESVSNEDLKSLLATLEDESAREALAAKLRALLAAREAALGEGKAERDEGGWGQLINTLSRKVHEVSGEAIEATFVLFDFPELLRSSARKFADPSFRAQLLDALIKLAIIFAIGLIAEKLVRGRLLAPRRAVERREVEGWLSRLIWLMLRAALDVIPIAVFAIVSYGVLTLSEPRETTGLVAVAIINANVIARVLLTVALMILAPYVPGLRIMSLSDESALYAHIWTRRLVNTAVYGYVAAEALRLMGLSAGGHAVLLNLLGLVIVTMLVILILQNREAVSRRLRGVRRETEGEILDVLGLRRLLADTWHILAILYVCASYGVWVLGVEGGFEYVILATLLTLVILFAANFILTTLDRFVDRGFAVSDGLKERFPTLEVRANRYVPLLNGVIRILVYGVTLLCLLSAWGIESLAWLTGEMGRNLITVVVSIAVILAVALLVWEIVSIFIDRQLERIDSVGDAAKSARLRTLLPLLRNVVLVVLVVLVSLIVLSQIGINITPLLAGAGVVGLAVGFGAQKLVQDVITGVFILIEDTISVGDVVDLGGHGGLVEAMSIRSIKLRDLSGNVHTVPFSAVSTVLNMTKEFSFYLFDIGVAYKEDVDHVIAVVREISAEMEADETYGPEILEPLEVLGLDKFADSAVIIKARIKTKPIKQWMVGREFNRRMKARFDALGIEIPFPHRTVYFGPEEAAAAGEKAGAARLGKADKADKAEAASSSIAPSESGQDGE